MSLSRMWMEAKMSGPVGIVYPRFIINHFG